MAHGGSFLIDLAGKPKHNVNVSGSLSLGWALMGGERSELIRTQVVIAGTPSGGRWSVLSGMHLAFKLYTDTGLGKLGARRNAGGDCLARPAVMHTELNNKLADWNSGLQFDDTRS